MKGYLLPIYFRAATFGLPTSPSAIEITDPSTGREYTELTTINDTDQDVKISFAWDNGVAASFIVNKSIRGFTIRTCPGRHFNLATFKVNSMNPDSQAAGNLTLNFLG